MAKAVASSLSSAIAGPPDIWPKTKIKNVPYCDPTKANLLVIRCRDEARSDHRNRCESIPSGHSADDRRTVESR